MIEIIRLYLAVRTSRLLCSYWSMAGRYKWQSRIQQLSHSMDIIQISPPKRLTFSPPEDHTRTLTVTNLTLRSVFVYVLQSHPLQISLSHPSFILEAFQEHKVTVAIRLDQATINAAVGAIRIYYAQIDEEATHAALTAEMFAKPQQLVYQDLAVELSLDSKTHSYLNYRLPDPDAPTHFSWDSPQTDIKHYSMRLAHPTKLPPHLLHNQYLQQQILSYLQQQESIASIEPSNNNCLFVTENHPNFEDYCHFMTFEVEECHLVYVIGRIVASGEVSQPPTLVQLEGKPQIHKPAPKQVKDNVLAKTQPVKIAPVAVVQRAPAASQIIVDQQLPVPTQHEHHKNKKAFLKQSFAVTGQLDAKPRKRRNKSEEKIREASSEDEADARASQQFFREELRNLRRAKNFEEVAIPVKTRVQIKIRETNLELGQKVLNLMLESKGHQTHVYVLLRDCVHYYILEDPAFRRVLKFDAINEKCVDMPCPMDIYKGDLIFGNECYLFWVNLNHGHTEWKYVQRKYIYGLAVIEQLSLVVLGGKNFSKLSYLGKETTRSNLKLYSCSSLDKNDHLFTYDIPGTNVGNVANLAYIATPPHSTKLLLVHTLTPQNHSKFYFLRVKAYNKIEVYGEVDLDELGILNLVKIRHNRLTSRIVCMESLNGQIDSFKKLKVRCQYEKIEVSTEGLKFPMLRYRDSSLGGGRSSQEWMCALEQGGKKAHMLTFEDGEYTSLEIDSPNVRQVISVNGGQFSIFCMDTMLRIREKQEVEIKE